MDEDTAFASALGEAFSRGARAWPDIALERATFDAHVVARLAEPSSQAIEMLCAEDLFLACACAHGDARAMARFDEHVLSQVPRYVAGIDASGAFGDEVRQDLRDKLFVGRGDEPPKIHEYTGRGPLGGWIRVAATRLAMNARRSGARGRAHEEAAGAAAVSAAPVDPELDYLRYKYGDIVRDAIEATVHSLPVDERNVLRMHYLDGLTLDAIAAVYGVHRATVARWVASARSRVIATTRRRLADTLGANLDDVDSILGLVQSRLQVSLRRVFEGT